VFWISELLTLSRSSQEETAEESNKLRIFLLQTLTMKNKPMYVIFFYFATGIVAAASFLKYEI